MCVTCTSQYVEIIGHLHEDGKVEEFKATDYGDSFGEAMMSLGVSSMLALTNQDRRVGYA